MRDGNEDTPVTVFHGPRAACDELSLVFEATAVPHDLTYLGGDWAVNVAPGHEQRAREQMARYAVERTTLAARQRERSALQARRPFGGAIAGAAGYALALSAVAWGAGDVLFGVDWVDAGGLQATAHGNFPDWWRAITALTLHQGAEHLVSNLAFGVAGGVLCTRLFGYGFGWLSILAAGALANLIEMWIAPAGHAAIGASTAVFGSVGLLSGYTWRLRLTLRERWLYRWTPLIGGVSLLALLGAGGEHVDVLGHLLGFLVGLGLGWVLGLAGVPRSRRAAPQNLAAAAVACIVAGAWFAALWTAGALG